MNSADNERPQRAFLITAAGSSSRMGGQKKEFCMLGSRSVLSHSVAAFLKTRSFSFGVVTCRPGTERMAEDLLSDLEDDLKTLSKPLMFCSGGAERQDSVFNGLKHLAEQCPELYESGLVLIHDGARPWVTPELIKDILEGTLKHSACAPIIPSTDAMKEINEKGIITGHHPREKTVNIQTPQGFSFSEILTAHERAADDGRLYIDDTEIFSRYEGDVYTVKGNTENKKITYLSDFGDLK